MMEEKAYRLLVKGTFEKIEKMFAAVDPDVAECENVQGALTITLAGRSKLVVSPQPSVRQVWLAVASQGKGYHFNYDEGSKKWLDDRGGGLELFGEISKAAGITD
jgi:iron donor protein CyaY